MLCLNQLLQWMVSCRHFEYTIRAERMISFLFDIFLGPSYNQSPPSVKYMTVTYSCVFLAPRLLIARRQMVENSDSIPIFTQSVGYHHVILSRSSYGNHSQDGKVCLSLLGTWQGPGWVSGKSTLLQVLLELHCCNSLRPETFIGTHLHSIYDPLRRAVLE
jgi:hypothetical protein